jgi:divalent metal cation (Fe/Co/Zn/Cd) transporter
VPLGIAFLLARRPPTRRYTYGYGRAEDLAGIAIIVLIAASSALAAYTAFSRLAHPRPRSGLIAVGAAALVGFAGNELVAGYRIWHRLMDAVDPALVDTAEHALLNAPGVLGTGQLRLRWVGHELRAECEVIVDPAASAVDAHRVAVSAEHNLLHALPRLTAALVHADPQACAGGDPHAVLASHR